MDRFLGTKLQPGGMVEATENSLASIAGGIVALVLLRWWWGRGPYGVGGFERTVAAPLAAYWALLRGAQEPGPAPAGLLNREEEGVLRGGVEDGAVALHLPAPLRDGSEGAD